MARKARATSTTETTTTRPRRTSQRRASAVKPPQSPSSSSSSEDEDEKVSPTTTRKETSRAKKSSSSSAKLADGENNASAQLLRELIQAHQVLRDMPQQQQDEEEDGGENDPILTQWITALSKPDILTSSSPQIRFLAARCLVDVLFICSPNAPFSSSTLKLVFSLLISSLKGLKSIPNEEEEEGVDENSAFACAKYVLHKMAICKLSCILVDLPENEGGRIKTSELVTDMFNLVFTSISPKHNKDVELWCIDLLAGYLDEIGEDVEALQIDQVLTQLLPESKRESMRAYDLATGVLQTCTMSRIRAPISTFLRGTLLGEFALDRLAFMQACSEQCTINNQDTVFQVLVELFKINPDLLLFVLPAVESVLEHHEEEQRQKAVRLCCTLFGEMRNHANAALVDEHAKLLDCFLARAFDARVEIRLLVLRFVCRVLSAPPLTAGASPASAARLVEALLHEDHAPRIVEAGLRDGNAEIRGECVEIASVLLTSHGTIAAAPHIAKCLGERLTDISLPIALRAMEGLAWAYAANPTNAKLEWIPTSVLSVNAKRESRKEYRQVELQRLSLLDNALLSTSSTAGGEPRIARINALYTKLDGKAKTQFKRLALGVREQWRTHLLRALEDKSYLDSADAKLLLEEGEGEEEREYWQLVCGAKDRAVFDLLRQTLLNVGSARRDLVRARKEILERLGACWQSQRVSAERITKAKQFVRDVMLRCAVLWTICADDIAAPREEARILHDDLLTAIIERFPAMFETNAELLTNVLDEGNGLVICTLGCSVNFENVEAGGGELALQCKEKVMAVLNGGDDAALQPLAIKALLRLKHQDELVDSFNEKPSTTWTLPELSVLLAMCKEQAASSSSALDEELVDVLLENVKREYGSSKKKEEEEEEMLKVVSIQLLAEFVVQQKPALDGAKVKRIVLMLRSIVADMGDPWRAQRERQRQKHGAPAIAGLSWPPPAERAFAALRLTCAAALMRVESVSAFPEGEEGDSATQLKRQGKRLVERARLAFDPTQENRTRFFKSFLELELERGVNMHRNAAFLCIIAAQYEGRERENEALLDLKSTVKFLAEKSREAKLCEDEAHATLFAPELILAHLVFFLAHHPLFPGATHMQEEEFAEFLKRESALLTRPVLLLVEALASAHPKAMDQSVSFLLGVLQRIRTHRDVLDWENHAIHCVGDLARLVIQQYSIRLSPDSLQVYRGRVPLPRPMYIDIHDKHATAAATTTPNNQQQQGQSANLSPVSYLPAGFDLDSLQVLSHKKGKRKSSGASASATPGTTKRPRLSASAKKATTAAAGRMSSAKKEDGEIARKQLPARAARMSLGGKSSFVESSSSASSSEEEEEDSDE